MWTLAGADGEEAGMRWARFPHPQGTGECEGCEVCFFRKVSLFALKGWPLTIFQIKKYSFPDFFLGGGQLYTIHRGCGSYSFNLKNLCIIFALQGLKSAEAGERGEEERQGPVLSA